MDKFRVCYIRSVVCALCRLTMELRFSAEAKNQRGHGGIALHT